MADLERVKFAGGPLNGAVLEMTTHMRRKLDRMELVITAGGKVADRSRGSFTVVPSIRVVELPSSRRLPEVTPAPRRRRPARRKTTD